MNNTEIQNTILRILSEKFRVDEAILVSSNWDAPLTGSPFRLKGADLVYLLFELEGAFGLRVESSDLMNYGFNSINRIAEVLGKPIK